MGQCWEILNFTYKKTKQNSKYPGQTKHVKGKKTGIHTRIRQLSPLYPHMSKEMVQNSQTFEGKNMPIDLKI